MQIDERSSSDLVRFLKALAEEGDAIVSRTPLDASNEEALLVLQQIDRYAREELAIEPPNFSAAPALWAARLFYHSCQFTLCRDISEEQIAVTLEAKCPAARSPETDWAADLTLRHLPKLFQFARQLSNADPLVARMQEIAAAWPLSSVGIAGLENLELDSFVNHPALSRLYADRISAAEDFSRLNDPRVRELLQSDLGMHQELAPAIAARLFNHDAH